MLVIAKGVEANPESTTKWAQRWLHQPCAWLSPEVNNGVYVRLAVEETCESSRGTQRESNNVILTKYFPINLMQELAKTIGQKVDSKKRKGKTPSEEQQEGARAGADSLTSYAMAVLDLARVEGVTDPEMVELIKQTIIDLKDVRQNLMRFREIKLTSPE
jgi:hypothetical protein